MAAKAATSYDEVREILKIKAESNKSKEKILVTARSVKEELKHRKNKDISTDTIREYGISKESYFLKNYDGCITYNQDGHPKKWGLVVNPQTFLDEVE